jgi:hypothetical protein
MRSTQIPSSGELSAEVAIVGAGPAGIVLALEMAARGHQVLLLESGGLTVDPEVQRLGDTVGHDPLHVSMSLSTSRRVGGASNLWGGRCVPFDPIDFQPRAIVGDSRWPVDYEQLQPYFQRACDWCLCGEAVFDANRLAGLSGRSLVPDFPEGEVLASTLERWSLPTNFGQQYLSALEESSLITLVVELTCTDVVSVEDREAISHLQARTLSGSTVKIVADRYVLACGGLENTRLLLASTSAGPEGLGNHSGHLGHWYMAHVESRIARVHFHTPPDKTIYGHERDRDGVYVRRRLTFSQELLTDQEMPNAAIWLVNPEIGDPAHRSGILSFAYLMLASPFGKRFVAEGIRQAHVKTANPPSLYGHLRNVVRNLGPAILFALNFGYRRYLKRGRKVPGFFVESGENVYPLLYHGEHLPHRESHTELAEERDALGVPRLRTRIHFDERDVDAVLRAHRRLDAYLRSNSLGYLEYLYEDCDQAVRTQLFGGYHQAGTTRMSSRPEDGVVDSELAVHGFDDLFVASSSTFVTSGQANSTFMIIVFTLRLADYLHEQMTKQRPHNPS